MQSSDLVSKLSATICSENNCGCLMYSIEWVLNFYCLQWSKTALACQQYMLFVLCVACMDQIVWFCSSWEKYSRDLPSKNLISSVTCPWPHLWSLKWSSMPSLKQHSWICLAGDFGTFIVHTSETLRVTDMGAPTSTTNLATSSVKDSKIASSDVNGEESTEIM